MIATHIQKCLRFAFSTFPKFQPKTKQVQNYEIIKVIKQEQVEKQIEHEYIKQFKKNKMVSIPQWQKKPHKTTFLTDKTYSKIQQITKDTSIQFTKQINDSPNFFGIASELFSKGHKFSRKQKQKQAINIYYDDSEQVKYALQLAKAKIKSRQMADTRPDQANPHYFLKQAKRIYEQYPYNKITVFQGKQLLNEGFRLMHAVGRASSNQPIFINLSYNGDSNSNQWYSLVGKGVCFDSGGLNLKPTSGIKEMHMDKHGATSVLAAYQTINKLKLKINLTASMGFVQNFVNGDSYRPLDIIKSRKGIKVQIGNTDAQGRLVLADCMNWTQQKYKVKEMIELSTLTGAVVIALGTKHAGMFGNNVQMMNNFQKAGTIVCEEVWRLPVDQYHHELIKSKQADITNSPGKSDASSCQAAAFLQRFVEKDVKWIHLDIAGTSNKNSKATGYGAKLLIHYLKSLVSQA